MIHLNIICISYVLSNVTLSDSMYLSTTKNNIERKKYDNHKHLWQTS